MPWKLFCTVMHKDGRAYQVYCRRELPEEERNRLIGQFNTWGQSCDALTLSPDFRVTPSVFDQPATYTFG